MHSINKQRTEAAFTIIELLIVIVVIAVLAMIAIFSYAGMQNRAIDSRLQSDLRNNSKQLGVAYATDGTYPATRPALSTDPDTLLQYTRTSPTSYCLTVASQSNNKTFHMTNTSSIQEGPCSGHTIGTGGGEGGGSPSNDLYSILTPEAAKLKEYIDALNAGPGQLADYSMGNPDNMWDPDNPLNPTPITSFFSGWTTTTFDYGGVALTLPTDSDGNKLIVVNADGTMMALLFHGDALYDGDGMPDQNTKSSAVILTSDGRQLSPYIATLHDADTLVGPDPLRLMQLLAFALAGLVNNSAYGLTPSTTDAAALASIINADIYTVPSGEFGGPWSVRLDDPEAAGIPNAGFAGCQVTLEALDAQFIRPKSYSCP